MTQLDRYILKKFIAILLYATLGFITIFVLVDLIENLDKFLNNDASITDTVLYYIYYIPYIIMLTLPVCMLMSSLFALGSMAQHNELIATLSSGISLYRTVAPLLVLALMISVLAGIAGETIAPQANRLRLDIMRYDISKKSRTTMRSRRHIALQDAANRQVNIQHYDRIKKRINKANVVRVLENKIYERWDARFMEWDTLRTQWMMREVIYRRFTDSTEHIVHLDTVWYDYAQFTPDDLFELQDKPEEMNYAELNRFVERTLELGGDARKWIVDLYMKISYPLANFIIVLFGAPLASRKRRSGPAVGFGLGLLISFIYFVFMRSGQVLGHNGTLEPWLGAWIGNIVFGIGGIVVMFMARK